MTVQAVVVPNAHPDGAWGEELSLVPHTLQCLLGVLIDGCCGHETFQFILRSVLCSTIVPWCFARYCMARDKWTPVNPQSLAQEEAVIEIQQCWRSMELTLIPLVHCTCSLLQDADASPFHSYLPHSTDTMPIDSHASPATLRISSRHKSTFIVPAGPLKAVGSIQRPGCATLGPPRTCTGYMHGFCS